MEHGKKPGKGLAHFLPLDDQVDHAVVEEIFGPLKPFRKLLADGLLDHPGTGKADEGLGFGDIDVPEHGETGGHPAGGGIGQDRDEGSPCSFMTARAAEVLAICMRERMLSCIRAPPEAEKMMNGVRAARPARWRGLFSPPPRSPCSPP